MYYNSNRISVHSWTANGGTNSDEESNCPECGGKLVAVRPEFRVWHWRHSINGGGDCSMGGESPWHLEMKKIHLDAGFEIEYPLDFDDGRKLRFDAYNPDNHYAIREFVHSLSPKNKLKSDELADFGEHVVWILDGNEFVAERRKGVRRGG